MIQRFLGSPGPLRLIDVGANTGYWAARFLRVVPATYVGFEPDPRAFAELSARFPAGDLTQAAVGATTGAITLHQVEDSTYSTVSSYQEFASSQVRLAADVDVPLVRLEDCVPREFSGRTIVKIDVQGAEADVLRGMAALLPDVSLLMLETPLIPQTALDNDLGTVTHLLRPHGFAPVYFCRPGLDYTRFDIPVEHDVIFARVDDPALTDLLV